MPTTLRPLVPTHVSSGRESAVVDTVCANQEQDLYCIPFPHAPGAREATVIWLPAEIPFERHWGPQGTDALRRGCSPDLKMFARAAPREGSQLSRK